MKFDIDLPARYAVGTLHSEGIRSIGKNATFQVLGWYINHHSDEGAIRFIKDGNALAIRLVEPEKLAQEKKEQKKRERITLDKPFRSRRVTRASKSVPVHDSAKAKSNLIACGLLTQEEADDIFGTNTSSTRHKPSWIIELIK